MGHRRREDAGKRLLDAARYKDRRMLSDALAEGPAKPRALATALSVCAGSWLWGVRLLLRAGAPAGGPVARPYDLPLVNAVRRGGIGGEAHVRALLAAGASPNQLGSGGNTAIIEAGLSGRWRLIPALVEHGANVNHRNARGETALTSAAAWRHLKAVRQLLNCGADPNLADGRGGTALMLAAQRGQVTVVQALLASGANPSQRDDCGNDAAMHARGWGRPRAERLLLRAVVVQAKHGNMKRGAFNGIMRNAAKNCGQRKKGGVGRR